MLGVDIGGDSQAEMADPEKAKRQEKKAKVEDPKTRSAWKNELSSAETITDISRQACQQQNRAGRGCRCCQDDRPGRESLESQRTIGNKTAQQVLKNKLIQSMYGLVCSCTIQSICSNDFFS